MPSIEVVNLENKKVGDLSLSDEVFRVKINFPLVHQVIKAQLANRRQGTAKTKTKAEVRGGGKKPYKQKGTGNARRGSSRSPLIPGGGTMFGPQPRDYTQRTPKKMMQGALRSALTDRFNESKIIVIDDFKLGSPKTKPFAELLNKNFKAGPTGTKTLIVDSGNQNLELSGRNIKRVKILRTVGINVYDIIKHDVLMISKKAISEIDKRLATKASKATKTTSSKTKASAKGAET